MGHAIAEYDFSEAIRIVPGRESQFGHYFGGPMLHRQVDRIGNHLHLHLLYMLNTEDPLLSKVRRPNAQWLPLYHPCVYNGTNLSYQVVSETEIEILAIGEEEVHPNFPYPSFPAEFSPTPVSLEPIPYEVHKTIGFAAACVEAGLQDFAISEGDRKMLKRLDWPDSFAQIGGVQFLLQGRPTSSCRNPDCPNSAPDEPFNRHFMMLLGIVWNRPVPGVRLWGDDGAQTVYEICPQCFSISTWNACE